MYRPLRDLGDARTAVEVGAYALGEVERVRADLAADTALHSPGRTSEGGAPTGNSPVGSPRTRDWAPALLEVRALSVVRGDHATPPTSLEVAPGEIVALVGPTGSGKTSLLRALLGLERSITGAVRYGGLDLTQAGVGPGERPFAWVPQEPAIVAGSLASNIALGADFRRGGGGPRGARRRWSRRRARLAGRELAARARGRPALGRGAGAVGRRAAVGGHRPRPVDRAPRPAPRRAHRRPRRGVPGARPRHPGLPAGRADHPPRHAPPGAARPRRPRGPPRGEHVSGAAGAAPAPGRRDSLRP